MARPAVRTDQLLLDDKVAIRSLFGTIKNAYDKLGFTNDELAYGVFYRAMNWLPIRPAVVKLITDRWDAWQMGVASGDVGLDTGYRYEGT